MHCSSNAGVSKLFVRGPQAITQQFESRTSYIMWLLGDMSYSTEWTASVSWIYYFFISDKMSLTWWNDFAGRSLETPDLMQ